VQLQVVVAGDDRQFFRHVSGQRPQVRRRRLAPLLEVQRVATGRGRAHGGVAQAPTAGHAGKHVRTPRANAQVVETAAPLRLREVLAEQRLQIAGRQTGLHRAGHADFSSPSPSWQTSQSTAPTAQKCPETTQTVKFFARCGHSLAECRRVGRQGSIFQVSLFHRELRNGCGGRMRPQPAGLRVPERPQPSSAPLENRS
jgi:hypothetical protein